jgi:hypothetical protein
MFDWYFGIIDSVDTFYIVNSFWFVVDIIDIVDVVDIVIVLFLIGG